MEQGDYELILPSGLVILLRNCYYVPVMSRNIISISCLDLDGYSFVIKNNKITIHLMTFIMAMLYLTMVFTF